MPMELPPLRRIVTSTNTAGHSVIVEDGPPPAVRSTTRPGIRSSNIWATFGSPAPLHDGDRSLEILGSLPPRAGTLIKYIDFPPEHSARAFEGRPGGPAEPGLRRHPDNPRHPGMQESDTIDYAVVLSGEIYAVMDEGETLMKAGDVLIQRGTNHAWSNRSDAPCRVLIVLVDANRGP